MEYFIRSRRRKEGTGAAQTTTILTPFFPSFPHPFLPPSLLPSLPPNYSKYQASMEDEGDDTDMGEDVAMVRDSDDEQYWVEDI